MTSSTSHSASSTGAAGRSDEHPHRYTAALANVIETRWQEHWQTTNIFKAHNPGEPGFDDRKPKFYCLDMFPYPSGAGLHVGHPEGYTATDIICRYKRMKGFNVLHPMGWDAFGLPAEQYAIATGVHPAVTTRAAIDTFRAQLQRFGFSYDWSREFATIDPDYYRWTQWIWLQAYNAWYDESRDAARPISELVHMLEEGSVRVDVTGNLVFPSTEGDLSAVLGERAGVRQWHELSTHERREVIDSRRLAYMAEQVVNWCPMLGTVLANEEVIDGLSERGGYPVYRQPLKQWMFRITAYAERLLRDLDNLDWPESTRTMQREWIGRSQGAQIEFPLLNEGWGSLSIFTTRPDTIFGATYMVVAPEHALVDDLLTLSNDDSQIQQLRAYVTAARNRSDVERQESKEKTGVYTGINATNPATGKTIPVWCADYVLMGYGTGAIMAVPGQDERDYEFAEKFNLHIVRTVQPPADFDGNAYTGEGPAINSANDAVSLNGLHVAEAKARIIEWLEKENIGSSRVNYKLRDWLFSRQRYWGEPFPVVFAQDGQHFPVDESHLPVTLPEMTDYAPIVSDTPTPPLGKVREWVNTTARDAGVNRNVLNPDADVVRETNTMPGWAGSCWYYLRYCSPREDSRFVSRAAEQYWMGEKGVDLYIGGAEHAVLHLLYARFWHKVLFDLGEVSTPEPMQRLFHQGMILSHAWQRADGSLVPSDEVRDDADDAGDISGTEIATAQPLTRIVAKMSKSLKNVVNPDDVIAEYGADTFRLYEMYMGPLDASKPWNTRDIAGPFRFLQRVWRLAVDEATGALATIADDAHNADVERALHRTIQKVGEDIERLAMNTAIAALMEFTNTATAAGGMTVDQLDRLMRTLAPFAPHIAEEVWARLGHDESLTFAPWPSVDAALLVDDEVELPVQIMGKVRARIVVPADADAAAIESMVRRDATVIEQLAGRAIRKIIIVPGKIVNIVAG
ncbi:MAG: leucine--tRNA ligase [Phycisphaerales bacterium]